MSSTAGDEGQGGRFGVKAVRTCRLLLAAILSYSKILSRSGASFIKLCIGLTSKGCVRIKHRKCVRTKIS